MNTNQAFIKAYRHDSAQPLPAGHTGEAAAPARIGARPVATHAKTASYTHADVLGATIAYVSPAAANEADFDSTPLTIQAALRLDADVSPYAPDVPERHEPILPAPYNAGALQTAPRSAAPKRPLSAFMKQQATVSDPAPLLLRPGTTVASFRMPMACHNLLMHHGRIFDRISNALLAQADAGRALVGVLGMFRGTGCTAITLCLAARLADCDRRIAVVDGHFQAPQLANCLDAEPTAWWQDVLERGAALGDALVRAEEDRFDLLPLNPYSRSTPPALQLAATAGALRHAYELSLVDLGTFFDPVSQPTALELLRHMRIESAVVVAGPAANDPRDLETVSERLAECGCELLGTIDNRVVS